MQNIYKIPAGLLVNWTFWARSDLQ